LTTSLKYKNALTMLRRYTSI